MRCRTGAVGTAVAIAALVPLAGPAHGQGQDRAYVTHLDAVQAAPGSAPGAPVGPGTGKNTADGRPGGARPDPASLPTISATSRPRPPSPDAIPAPSPTALAPSRGVVGGLGGASDPGPSGWDVGIGLACVTSAALAGGLALRRRLRR